jgi:hypothetical protein
MTKFVKLHLHYEQAVLTKADIETAEGEFLGSLPLTHAKIKGSGGGSLTEVTVKLILDHCRITHDTGEY